MIPRPGYVLPAQRAIFEQGGNQGLPLAGGAIASKWFDAYQVHKGGIQAPQTGAIVSSGNESIRGVGTTLRVGAYFLDVWCDHDNAAHAPFRFDLHGAIADALEPGAVTMLHFADWWVPPAAFVAPTTIRGNFRRFTIHSRLFRISSTYAASNATRFSLSAVLRAR